MAGADHGPASLLSAAGIEAAAVAAASVMPNWRRVREENSSAIIASNGRFVFLGARAGRSIQRLAPDYIGSMR